MSGAQAQRQVYLVTEGVDSCYYLFVNEAFVGYNQVTHTTGEFDLTGQLRAAVGADVSRKRARLAMDFVLVWEN